jgi:hypothetical protein
MGVMSPECPESSKSKPLPIYERVRHILNAARTNAARSVNITQVIANWLVGREIVEEEQHGKRRAGYGERLIRDLAARLQAEYGIGYSLANVKFFRKFYLEYPRLAGGPKGYALRSLFLSLCPRVREAEAAGQCS